MRRSWRTRPGLTKEFTLDYSIDPRHDPVNLGRSRAERDISPPGICRQGRSRSALTSDAVGDQYFIPGVGQDGRRSTSRSIGAETLKAGTPLTSAGCRPSCWRSAMAAFAVTPRRHRPAGSDLRRRRVAPARAGPVSGSATDLRRHHARPVRGVQRRLGAGLAALSGCAACVNAVSGLANLNALRGQPQRTRAGADRRPHPQLCGDRRHPAAGQRAPAGRTDRRRLSVGSPSALFYQGDGGIFAWFEEPQAPVRQPHRRALFVVPQSRPGRRPVDRRVGQLRGRDRQQPLARRTASPARWSPPRKPRTTGSNGNTTTPTACRMRRGSCRC